MKKIVGIYLLMFLIVWIASCQPTASDEKGQQGLIKDMNKETMSKMASSICAEEEQLVEVDRGSFERFYNLAGKYKAYGFLKDTGLCALRKDFNRDSLLSSFFSVTLYDNCLTNGSLWIQKSLNRQDNKTYLELTEFGGSLNKVTKLTAGYEVKLREIQTLVGLRVYKCTPK